MSDLIDRQAAIDALNKLKIYRPLDSDRYVISDCLNKIVNLPSAQPQRTDEWCTDCAEYDHEKHCCPRFNQVIRQTLDERKTGKWIERKHGYWSFVNDKGERDGWIPSYECSECGSGGWITPEVMNFCPNCGARMEGEG